MEFDALIIGAGLSGIAAAYHFSKLGMRFKVLEANSGEGGTWFWNRYPGCRFDSESWTYGFSFSREVLDEWAWTEHFSAQPETLRYAQFLTQRLDLRQHIQFDTTVTSAYFQEHTRSWLVKDTAGQAYNSRFLITATGPQGRPTLPNIRGLSDFEGLAFHTAHWPTHLNLSGKKVGIIGTGASGIQVVQSIARTDIASLTVFQRTPQWSVPLHNSPITEQEHDSIRKHYDQIFKQCSASHYSFVHSWDQRKTFDVPEEERLQFWETLYAQPGFPKWLGNFEDVNHDAAANAAYSEFVAGKIRRRVRDPGITEKLIPRDHDFGTKRVPLETSYFEAFNEPHVRLVDTRNETPIERITSTGVLLSSSGENIPLDVLIYATGFENVTRPLTTHIDIRGSNGVKLSDVWLNGPRTYLGMFVPEMPNFMMVVGPSQPSGNIPRQAEFAASWISDFVAFCTARGITRAEATQEAAESWEQHLFENTRDILSKNAQLEGTSSSKGKTGNKYCGFMLRYNGPAPKFRKECRDAAAKGYCKLRLT